MGKNPRSSVGCAASFLVFAMIAAFHCPATLSAAEGPSVELPVFRKLGGDCPVAQLDRLSEGQRRSRIGNLGEQNEFAADPRNATYTVGGRQVSLHDGRYETEAAPGSASRITTVVFGKPVAGDLDGDGVGDAALFLIYSPGGSGTSYYVAASINEGGRFRGTNAVLLGDRITPRQIGIRDGVVVVDYADRRPDDPMAASPSVCRSKYLTLHNGRLTEKMPHGEGK